MEEKGTRVRIVSKHGYSYSSLLSVEVVQDNLRISWRSNPERLGVDMMYLREIVQSATSDRRLHLLFQGLQTCGSRRSHIIKGVATQFEAYYFTYDFSI